MPPDHAKASQLLKLLRNLPLLERSAEIDDSNGSLPFEEDWIVTLQDPERNLQPETPAEELLADSFKLVIQILEPRISQLIHLPSTILPRETRVLGAGYGSGIPIALGWEGTMSEQQSPSGGKMGKAHGSTARRGEEEAAAFSLLAARVASTAERAARGLDLSRQDQLVLATMSRQLRIEAEAVTNDAIPSTSKSEPASAVAAGFTVDVVLQQSGKSHPSDEEMVGILVRIADSLEEIPKSADPQAAKYISFLFKRVSSLARSQAGVVAERVTGRDVEFTRR